MSEIVLKDLGTKECQAYQPQNQYPCFFIDGAYELVPGKYVKGFKNFTYNEWFMPAHFPDEPNVHGCIQLEMLDQFFLLTFMSLPENKGKKAYSLSVQADFKKEVIPGDRVEVEAYLESYKRGVAIGHVIGRVKGEVSCTVKIKAGILSDMMAFAPKI